MASGKGDFKLRLRVNPSPAAIARVLGELGKDFRDYRPVWRLLAPIIAYGMAQSIQARGAALGESWPQESRAYARRKAREGKGRVELAVSGKLIADMTSAGSVLGISARRLTFGTRLPYARAVNFGFTTKGGKTQIRARKFAGWTEYMKRGAAELFDIFAKERLKEASAAIASLSKTEAA
jgi:phage gpG-like protein